MRTKLISIRKKGFDAAREVGMQSWLSCAMNNRGVATMAVCPQDKVAGATGRGQKQTTSESMISFNSGGK